MSESSSSIPDSFNVTARSRTAVTISLLFFAPVAHAAINDNTKKLFIKESILTLIQQFDELFDTLFTNFYNGDTYNFCKNLAGKANFCVRD